MTEEEFIGNTPNSMSHGLDPLLVDRADNIIDGDHYSISLAQRYTTGTQVRPDCA